ncbi:MAG: hypothetical protein F4128_01190 [Gammaproteobacteria bacterium]|nr:hypothetical protein [Gammaproteobacteria bacterium]
MKEITDSIYRDPDRLFAGVRTGSSRESSLTFLDRRGLESLIFARRARVQDTGVLEDQLAVLARSESSWSMEAQ